MVRDFALPAASAGLGGKLDDLVLHVGLLFECSLLDELVKVAKAMPDHPINDL
jgi:hypothetical protein